MLSLPRRRADLFAVLATVALTTCMDARLTQPTRSAGALALDPVVLVGAGDIARCTSLRDEQTAALLDSINGTVFTLGDNVYEYGTAAEFAQCYGPSWGRHRARTRPVAGNHEYSTPGASGYFGYFGAAAGDPAQGYYSYGAGAWRIIVLNSNIPRDAASPQVQWLAAELRAAGQQCVAAMWHHARFSSTSGRTINNTVLPFWDTLYAYGADLVLVSHDHVYERFAPMRPDGTRDDTSGLRQFTIGTGGAGLYPFGTIHPNSEARNNSVQGVVKLTLDADRYSWEFVAIAGTRDFDDTGTTACHGPPGGEPPVDSTPPPAPGADTVLIAAGNIAACTSGGMQRSEATAKLIDVIPGTVVTLGDNAFPSGAAADYANCYQPSWGRHRARTYAALGNHEYQSGSANGSFDYFGERAGPRGLGYYSFDLGAWHIVVLNDNAAHVPYAAGSVQDQWLQQDLAANSRPCTLAVWHVPLFLSSNGEGYIQNPSRRTLWNRLHAAGADVVLNGHQHHYERMAPMRPDGTLDTTGGIRQFNAGTGGESAGMPTVAIHPNSEVRSVAFGVLKLRLKSSGYEWDFRSIAGTAFADSGSGNCH